MSEWQVARLGDKVDNLNRLRVPLSGIERSLRQGRYRYFGAQGVIDYVEGFLFDGEYLLVAEDGENLRSRKQPIASLVSGQFWVNNHAHVLRVRDRVANSSFILHAINHAHLGGFVTGAAQPKLTKANLERLTFLCPSRETQDRVAALLAAFDELIDINERRIELLEDLARSLYCEWFVRFRFPGYDDATRAQSADGPIPPGWSVCALGDLAEVANEGVSPTDVAAGSPYVGLEHLPRGATTLKEWGAPASVTSRKLRFMRGDTLFGKIRPYFHKVVWAPFDGVVSSDAIVIRSRAPAVPALVNAVLSSDALVAEAVATANGTKMPRADPNVLLRYPVALPELDSELVIAGERALRSWAELCAILVGQNVTFARTRDLLLPRLVTGQIDLSDVDLEELLPEEDIA